MMSSDKPECNHASQYPAGTALFTLSAMCNETFKVQTTITSQTKLTQFSYIIIGTENAVPLQ